MSPRRLLISEALYNLGVFSVMYTLAALPVAMLAGYKAMRLFALFALAQLLFIWVRMKVRSLMIFMLIHMAAVGAMTIIPGNAKYAGLAFMLIIAFISIRARFSNDGYSYNFAIVVAHLILALLVSGLASSSYAQRPEASSVLPIAIGANIICCYVFKHLNNLDHSLSLITRTTEQPVKTILSMNNKAIALFSCAVAGVAVWASQCDLENFAKKFVEALKSFIIWIVGGILNLLLLFASNEDAPLPEAPQTAAPDIMELAEPYEANPIAEIIGRILAYALIIAAFAGAAIGAVYICWLLYKKFYSSRTDGDEKEFLAPEIFAVEAIKKNLRGLIPHFGSAEKTRRLFRKRIKRFISKGVPIMSCDTPEDMMSKIPEDISALTAKYQQARYIP
ncbi:MAG: hypothetical protein LBU32_04950 [Clostridiales bacterium]|jgi:hypothetical protein|nr:hypothetical protein [Clostridiales bacterium]